MNQPTNKHDGSQYLLAEVIIIIIIKLSIGLYLCTRPKANKSIDVAILLQQNVPWGLAQNIGNQRSRQFEIGGSAAVNNLWCQSHLCPWHRTCRPICAAVGYQYGTAWKMSVTILNSSRLKTWLFRNQFITPSSSGPDSTGLTHKRTKRALRAPSCKGVPSKTGRKLMK